MICRPRHLTALRRLLEEFPVVALIGARQVGKTTLARTVVAGTKQPASFFDLEDRRDLARLEEPSLALEKLEGLVVLDEIQRLPDLFTVLRVLADRTKRPARFLVLGSASQDLLRQSSESLAGRIVYHELGGLDLEEVTAPRIDELWLRGGLPPSFTSKSDEASALWRREFIRTFLERDLSALGFRLPPETMRRFWNMLAHYHGQLWNGAELARAFGVAEKTVRHYLDILCSTFMALRLESWHENIAKRQVKSPKVYLTDSGVLHSLLGIETRDDLLGHPKRGASWEGFVLQAVLRQLGARREERYFWALHSGAELDLLVVRGRRRLGFEVKFTDAPRVTPSMRSALSALSLDRLDVLHAGKDTFPLGEKIRAVAVSRILDDVERL